MKHVLVAIATVLILYTLFELRHALLTIYVAVVLAILFDPVVELVQRITIGRYHPGRGFATAVVALATVLILLVVALVIVPPIASDAAQLREQWPAESARLFDWIHGHLPFSRSITQESAARWFRNAAGGSPVLTIGTGAMDVLTTLLLTVYMIADGPRAFEWMISLAAVASRPRLRTTLRSAGHRMQGWVAGQGLLMLTHGGSALVTFWLIGLPYVVPLAVFAAVINIIPVLGPILTLFVAGLVAAINSPGKLLGVAIFYLAYHNAEGIYLQPKIMASAVGVPGVAIVAALIIGGEVAGIVGMALSVPTAVLIAEIKKHYTPGARLRTPA